MSLAMKYAMKKRMGKSCPDCAAGECMAHGGKVKGADKGVHKSVYGGPSEFEDESQAGVDVKLGKMDEAKERHKMKLAELKGMKKPHLYAEGGDVDGDDDLVMKIMKKRYSKGGMVANDTPPVADEEAADFDVLATDDDLEMHETGANSGDEIGDEQEDEDRKDIVSKIMKSRKKKDKNPRPA